MLSSLSFSPWLFIAGILVLMAVIGFVYFIQHQLIKNNTLHIESLKEQLGLIKTISVSQGKKIIKVSSRVKELDKNKDFKFQEPVVNKSYQQAAKMLAMGAEPEEIMDCCELTRGEIQLISQLNLSAKNPQPYH